MQKAWNHFSDYFGKTILHPQYFLKKYEYEAVLEAKKLAHGIFIDIGCGRQSYKKEILEKVKKYIGVDHPKASKKYKDKEMPDVYADAEKLPFKASFADTASMISVLEHIPNPALALREAHRVLKTNGFFVLITVQNYPLHDAPYDFFRFTRFSLKNMFIEAGFRNIKVTSLGNFPIYWGQMLNVYLLNSIKKNLPISFIFLVPVFFICILSNLAALLLSSFTDYEKGAFAIYNLVIAKK